MSADDFERLFNATLLVLAVAVLVLITLIVWATVLFFKVQMALERLQRALNASRATRSNGAPRRLKERA